MSSVRQINDLAAPAGSTADPLGMDATRAIARQIADAVRDPKMHYSIPLKVARAVTEKRLNASELTEILDCVVAQRVSGRLRSPGAYFVTSIKRAFQRNEIAW